jgi:hypothetical protein
VNAGRWDEDLSDLDHLLGNLDCWSFHPALDATLFNLVKD